MFGLADDHAFCTAGQAIPSAEWCSMEDPGGSAIDPEFVETSPGPFGRRRRQGEVGMLLSCQEVPRVELSSTCPYGSFPYLPVKLSMHFLDLDVSFR